MAPPTAAAKSRRTGPQGKAGPKSVVPVIPLPYMKRQAAAAAAAAAASKASIPVSRSDVNEVNAAAEVKAEELESPVPVVSPPAELEPRAGAEVAGADAVETHQLQFPVVHAPSATSVSAQSVDSPPSAATSIAPAIVSSNILDATTLQSEFCPTAMLAKQNAIAAASSTAQEPSQSGRARPSTGPDNLALADRPPAKVPRPRQPPPISPTHYQMPSSFQPIPRPMANGEMPRGPRVAVQNGPPHIPHAHSSNGGVHFGTFQDSTSSSPAPPHSGGIAPPPGMTFPDARQPYMTHAANGYPAMMPYGAEMMPVPGFDNYGRPNMGYAPMESYPPYGNNLGPSTPHSFHESQSSSHPEDGAVPQYASGAPRNGVNGPAEEAQAQNQKGRMFGHPEHPRMVPSQSRPQRMMPQGDDAEGMVGYLQQQFGVPDLGDCTLELRYLDDRAPPVRIPGHRLLFARSSVLGDILRRQALQSSPADQSLQIILLKTDSRWLRSDSFYMAVQRLYGLPLLHIQASRPDAGPGEFAEAGSAIERFEFALSYAAAGHLLNWNPVVRRGCEVAVQFLGWQTLERAFEFALDGYSDKGSYESYKYGDGSKILLHEIVTFIVNNLPPTFDLDTSVENPEQIARLPPLPVHGHHVSIPQGATELSPVITRGTPMQIEEGHRRQLSTIQFGDLSLSDNKNGMTSKTTKGLQQGRPTSHAILSRILLNLPFTSLKAVLESAGSGNVHGWANAESRSRSIKAAVAEREIRRLRAVDDVVAGRIPGSDAMRQGLRSPEPSPFDRWGALGWQEEIIAYGNPDAPSLSRKWAPLMELSNGVVAEFP